MKNFPMGEKKKTVSHSFEVLLLLAARKLMKS